MSETVERQRIARQRGQTQGRASSIRRLISVFLEDGPKRGTAIRKHVHEKLDVPESAVATMLSSMVRTRALEAEYSGRGGGKLYRRPGTGMPVDEDGAKTALERRTIAAVVGNSTVAEVCRRDPSVASSAKEVLEALVRRGVLVRSSKEGKGSYRRP